VKKLIPYARHDVSEEDIAAVSAVLRSDFIAQGPAIDRLEKAMAEYVGVTYAVAVANATAGLHLACLALGVGRGDLHWTSPITFVASANCALYCGADVDFVDIDPRTTNMSVDALAKKLASAKRLPKTVMPVHFTGQSCRMDEIAALAKKYGFAVIEDAAHAIGGTYKGKRVGACEYSDVAVISFQATKVITSGEGGLIFTNRRDVYERLLRLRTHGITRDKTKMVRPPKGPWEYQQLDLGYHYRLTDLQAAFAYSQFQRLETFLARRRELCDRYERSLTSLPVKRLHRDPDASSGHHLYVIRLDSGHLAKIGKTHRQAYEELWAEGIGVNLHYVPVHTQPYFENLGFRAGQFPEAEKYYEEAVTLPFYYGLTNDEQDYVVASIKKVLTV
jgi:UDP-4-amino-4,6-dideoxy-N-acetyl-beta-L-altrosamine transaminase